MPKKITLSNDFVAQVKQLFEQEEHGTRKIAQILNVPRDRVMNAFKLLNIDNAGRNNPRRAHKATEKACKMCGLTKPISDFRKRYKQETDRTSYEVYCLVCEKVRGKKEYHENIDESREYYRDWHKENRDKVNGYERERSKSDPAFKLRKRVSASVRAALSTNNAAKMGSILNHLPYTMEELKAHLESQFEPWMSWNNYGKYDKRTWNDDDQSTWKWNIDHRIPQSDLPYGSMNHPNFQECWALVNMRPYKAKQNVLDGNRRDE